MRPFWQYVPLIFPGLACKSKIINKKRLAQKNVSQPLFVNKNSGSDYCAVYLKL
jgi:hypothetical protein